MNPKPYLSWDKDESPWINENDLREQGGIFIWDEGLNYTWDLNAKYHSKLPKDILKRFPELQILANYSFIRNSDNYPIVIGVAILPPKNKPYFTQINNK